MSPQTRRFSYLLTCWLLSSVLGCATTQWPLLGGKVARKATARNPVTQMVCLWECAEGRDANGAPCQGFAGQILFLANRGVLPVTVDGEVRIYLFDNQGTIEEQAEPIHILNFDSGSWAQAYSYGALGPSYNVFVPYTRKGIANAMCGLRVRFTPKKGPVVFSDVTNIELISFKGAKTAKDKDLMGQPVSDPRVEQTIPMDLTADAKLRRTTTISLHPDRDLRNGLNELQPVGTDGNQVQFAGYEEAAGRGRTDGNDRIAQLEQMVRDLQQQKQAGPQRVTTYEIGDSAAVLETNDPDGKPSRIKIRSLDSAERDVVETNDSMTEDRSASAATHPLDEDEGSTLLTRNRRSHPLDDDTKSQNVRTSLSHPLAGLDDDQSVNESINPAINKHPLFDTSAERPKQVEKPKRQLQPLTPKGPSKLIPASDPLTEASRDPFEPIDVETAK